eukprot:2651379-Rhodomonas_salina.1
MRDETDMESRRETKGSIWSLMNMLPRGEEGTLSKRWGRDDDDEVAKSSFLEELPLFNFPSHVS